MKLINKNKNLAAGLSFIVFFTFMFSVFVLPNISVAQDNQTPKPPDNTNPTKPASTEARGRITNPLGNTTTFQALLAKVLQAFISIATPLIVLAIVYCGFLFVTARGKSEAITKAKNAFFYTLIGAAILLGAVTISRLISATITSL